MIGKKGGLWKWFWLCVVLIALGVGLYYLIAYVTDIDTIRAVAG